MRLVPPILMLLFVLVLAPGVAQADDPALFTVSGIATDAAADSAAAARQPALVKGQRLALQAMLRRLTLAADHNRLPNVSDVELQALVRNIQISDERASGQRYAARISVSFDPNGIRSLLRGAGIPFTEAVAKPVLLVPVLDSDGRRLLWEENNPWRQAWAQRAADPGLLPINVPIGDLADADALDATQAASLDETRLRKLADRYKLDDIAVANANLKRVGGGLQLQVTLTRLGAGNEATLVLSYSASGDNVPALMEEAVRDIAGRLEERWKQATMIKPGDGGSTRYSVTVPLTSLADWVSVRDRLSRVSGLDRLEVLALTKQDAQLQFTYGGDPQQLTLLMAQRDLDLKQGTDGYWVLKPKAGR